MFNEESREPLKLPYYASPNNPSVTLEKNVSVHMLEVVSFLSWIVNTDHLEIARYFKQIDQDSFFMVAATGLGKTVGIPIHVLLRQIQRCGGRQNIHPKVWIVEPRIPIAVDQAEYMNALWDRFRETESRSKQRTSPLFGQITSQGRRGHEAPIQFVTTGIFELYARMGKFDPVRDRVVIDEAHVTVEQNPGVELGIALCREKGVTVDYMSATVDVATIMDDLGVSKIIRADQARGIIWKSNLLKPIMESVAELLQNTLVAPDPKSRFFPDASFPDAKAVIESALKEGRSHGMLIVVNSFNGSTSDIKQLSSEIRSSHPGLAVLHLASDIIRSPRLQTAFKAELRAIEARRDNYVILSTSVVEMGITFPTLDYVVTMDSGYDQETIGDVTFPVVAPLGVNSLLQRIGRVGRRHPGIAYISNEVDAPYSTLEDSELNANALAYEPIRYPLNSAPLMSLAYYGASQEPEDIREWVASLHLPSRLHESDDRMEFLAEQFEKLELLGITEEGKLTELGVLMRGWIGRADIAYATQLQRRFAEGGYPEEIIFWVVATALSNTPISSLRSQHGYFIDYDDSHKEIAHRYGLWADAQHEDLVLFDVVRELAVNNPGIFWNASQQTGADILSFYTFCNWAGIDGRKFLKVAKSIRDTMKLFSKINGKSEWFAEIFDSQVITPEQVDWLPLQAIRLDEDYPPQLQMLAGTTDVLVSIDEESGRISWRDLIHGHEGLISQDDTPLLLEDGGMYTARVTPSRRDKSSEMSWRLTSIGVAEAAEVSSTPIFDASLKAHIESTDQMQSELATEIAEVHKRSSFLSRLFGR